MQMTAYFCPTYSLSAAGNSAAAMTLTLTNLHMAACKPEPVEDLLTSAADFDSMAHAVATGGPIAHAPGVHLQARGSPPDSGAEAGILDNSLTSLGWLQNLRVLDLFSPDVISAPLVPPSPNSEDALSWESVSSLSPGDDRSKQSGSETGISLSPIRRCLVQSNEFKKSPKKYRTRGDKPPFSFTTLIFLAITHKSGQASLSEIYRWIKTNFKYYRTADRSWQNSVRHNLSLNEMFVKVPREQTQCGTSKPGRAKTPKGNYWTINADYESILSDENGVQSLGARPPKLRKYGRKRAHSQSCCYGDMCSRTGVVERKRRPKSASAAPADPCGLPGDLNWVSLLSSQRVSCISCPSQTCRPVFGSPVLGPPDLGHIGDPVVCSPLVVPMTLTSEAAEIPLTPTLGENKGALLEEALLRQDSPSPQLLPWAEGQSQSPVCHPWAETREATLKRTRGIFPSLTGRKSMWSPDSSLSSSSSSVGQGRTGRIVAVRKSAPMLSETCLY